MSQKKGAAARKHRHGGWGALKNRHLCSPTQKLIITACPSKTYIDGIDGTHDSIESIESSVSPVCYSSVESEFSSYDRTAVYSEVPGESADLHFCTGVHTVTVPYFSRHFAGKPLEFIPIASHDVTGVAFTFVTSHSVIP